MGCTPSRREGFGLRTLCLAYRKLEFSEVKAWSRKYAHACSQLGPNREKLIDKVQDDLERDLILLGATAIEDKLQELPPHHKPDVVLQSPAPTRASLPMSNPDDLASIVGEDNGRRAGGYGLVIDGGSLNYALEEPFTREALLELATRCAAVVCCRTSPKQKAEIVRLVKEGIGAQNLAIGDGANDVSMIQTADIRVGVSGEEGMQAVNSSDYAITKFRFLSKLLFVHGHWSYDRNSRITALSHVQSQGREEPLPASRLYNLLGLGAPGLFFSFFNGLNGLKPWAIPI
ncbi:hypothetical protein PGT21_027380 [Puccinia graminis f. sp. tritici]|uniref:P-type ATPase C-terminal domain-containing protein n=1 Tax=Puccinia graminis f. sp. tritici TaxID=56615 RepID=A0A5B0NGR7_PUCGR|nr:hypothetical protein PGT21_027380 [Puccinia graminis f. sp. tritici]